MRPRRRRDISSTATVVSTATGMAPRDLFLVILLLVVVLLLLPENPSSPMLVFCEWSVFLKCAR